MIAVLRAVTGVGLLRLLRRQPPPPENGWGADEERVLLGLFALRKARLVRVLHHAKVHVPKDRYIKPFDSAVLAAMKTLETTLGHAEAECRNRAAGKLSKHGKLLKTRRGEVAEWPNAAVC